MTDTVPATLPDLHSQAPDVPLPVASVGHVGVKRPVLLGGDPAFVTMDIGVGLAIDQRGAHMSRLISCARDRGAADLRAYVDEVLRELCRLTPGAPRWSVDAAAERLIGVDGGWKPVRELYRVGRVPLDPPEWTYGLALRVCMACPQAQAMIAHDAVDDEPGRHPTHNQVCDLTLHVSGVEADLPTLPELVAIAEQRASGPVREAHKRRSEADTVAALHERAAFAEDALRRMVVDLRRLAPDAREVRAEIVNHESIFEYPLHCLVTG